MNIYQLIGLAKSLGSKCDTLTYQCPSSFLALSISIVLLLLLKQGNLEVTSVERHGKKSVKKIHSGDFVVDLQKINNL